MLRCVSWRKRPVRRSLKRPRQKAAWPQIIHLRPGPSGLTRTDPAYTILDEADCILAIGFDVVELVKPWRHPAPLIWLAPWANQDPKLPSEVELVGPLATTLRLLTDSAFNTTADWGAQRLAAHRSLLNFEPLPSPAPGRLLPQTMLSTLRRHLPAEALLTVDVGAHKIFTSLAWPALIPNRFLLSNGLSSMGFALPSAIGASFGLRGQPIVCLTGDAGLAMVLGELGVLARLNAPVIVVVLNDGAIDLIRSQQRRAGKPVYGTEFRPPNFSQVAAAYGLATTRVHDPLSFANALQVALQSGRPALIEVMLDPASYPTTPHPAS